MGGLRLDTREGFFKGSDAGPIVEPGKPESSSLLKVLQHAAGYPGDAEGPAEARPGRPRPAGRVGAARRGRGRRRATAATAPVASHAKAITAEQRAFWSFAPLQAAPPPGGARRAWPATDIDRFVLARLESEGLHPVGRRRQAHAAAPGDDRPDRAAADARGDRRVPRRQRAERLRDGGRSAARLAALRRGLGPGVARRRPLRRRRLPQPRSDGPRLQSLSERATCIATG